MWISVNKEGFFFFIAHKGFNDRYLRFMISTTSSASLLVAVSLSSSRALACKKKITLLALPDTKDYSRYSAGHTSVSLIKDSSCRVVTGVESAGCA